MDRLFGPGGGRAGTHTARRSISPQCLGAPVPTDDHGGAPRRITDRIPDRPLDHGRTLDRIRTPDRIRTLDRIRTAILDRIPILDRMNPPVGIKVLGWTNVLL